jgi:hypothetical protein
VCIAPSVVWRGSQRRGVEWVKVWGEVRGAKAGGERESGGGDARGEWAETA